MSFGVCGVERKRLAKFGFGFGEKALGQQLMSAIAVEFRMGTRIGFRKTWLSGSVDFQSKLAEGTFVVVGANTLGWSFWGASVRRLRCDSIKQRFGRGIRFQRERLAQLAGSTRRDRPFDKAVSPN